jgi:hypothetical protein
LQEDSAELQARTQVSYRRSSYHDVIHDESATIPLKAPGNQLNHSDRIGHVESLYENDRNDHTIISEKASMRTDRVMVLV